jgi:outer membrane protein assembly factor BamA
VSAAYPFSSGGEVALHQLVNLGGADTLRGYQPDRFLDRLGWWGSAEYRFLLSNYGGSLVGFSGAVFADVGKVGSGVEDLVSGNLPWSFGLAILAETDIFLLGRVQMGISPDGVNFSVGVGEPF